MGLWDWIFRPVRTSIKATVDVIHSIQAATGLSTLTVLGVQPLSPEMHFTGWRAGVAEVTTAWTLEKYRGVPFVDPTALPVKITGASWRAVMSTITRSYRVQKRLTVATWKHTWKYAEKTHAWIGKNPGVVGFAVGVIMPWLGFSVYTALTVTAVVAVAGYVSPEGTYLRNFSIGYGIGGALASGYLLYQALPMKGIIGLMGVAVRQPWYAWIPGIGPALHILGGGMR